MIASLNNHPQIVASLLRRGAYADAQNATGWTALMIAERKGHAEVARLLRHGRMEKPLPSLITSATHSDDGKQIDLSDFPEESPSDFPEQLKD
jgi:ankyrin repeat protein